MIFKNKFILCHILESKSSYCSFLVYFFIASCLPKLIVSERCSYINDCKCVFQNGSIIDLTSVGNKDKPRWQNMKPTLTNDSYTYTYNACHKFDIGNRDCTNVEVCQTGSGGDHFNCGDKAGFVWNNDKNTLTVIYTGDNRRTNVTLVCSPEARDPELKVIGETSTRNYEMVLTTRCACPDLCRESHLSAGSVLVILFIIAVFLYLVLGIVHSSLTRGAHGWELIPHHEFWADFPLLVRDGCVFVISGCKPETAYERI